MRLALFPDEFREELLRIRAVEILAEMIPSTKAISSFEKALALCGVPSGECLSVD